MSGLFIWRLQLKKRVARTIHLEALVREDRWQLCSFGGFGRKEDSECYNREGTVSVLVGLCKPMSLVPMFIIVHYEVKQKL
jgi:hypothetical protein